MKDTKALGALSVVLGIVSFIGILAFVPTLITTPLGIISGAVAYKQSHKTLGIIGILLSISAAVTLFILWRASKHWMIGP
jgi:hypothetical protein